MSLRASAKRSFHLVIPNRSETILKLRFTADSSHRDLMDDVERLFGYNVVNFE